MSLRSRPEITAYRSLGEDSASKTHAALVRLSRDAEDRAALTILRLRITNRGAIRAAVKRWLGNDEYHQSAAEIAVIFHLAKNARHFRSEEQEPLAWVSNLADQVCRSIALSLGNQHAVAENGQNQAKATKQ